jgi:hypothetical protein
MSQIHLGHFASGGCRPDTLLQWRQEKSSNLGIEKRDFKVTEFLFLKTLD